MVEEAVAAWAGSLLRREIGGEGTHGLGQRVGKLCCRLGSSCLPSGSVGWGRVWEWARTGTWAGGLCENAACGVWRVVQAVRLHGRLPAHWHSPLTCAGREWTRVLGLQHPERPARGDQKDPARLRGGHGLQAAAARNQDAPPPPPRQRALPRRHPPTARPQGAETKPVPTASPQPSPTFLSTLSLRLPSLPSGLSRATLVIGVRAHPPARRAALSASPAGRPLCRTSGRTSTSSPS